MERHDAWRDVPTTDLLARARDGEREAAEALARRLLPRLQRWAHGRLPPAARTYLDTKDIVHDVWLRVVPRRNAEGRAPPIEHLAAYLRKAVENRLCDELRTLQARPNPVHFPGSLPAAAADVEWEAMHREQWNTYESALAALSERDRTLVVMRLEWELSYSEVARELGCSPDAARMSLRRAVARLGERVSAGKHGRARD